ncbi:hypothetical protein GpartN1_g6946.t1 [Galdieria partita]|uniref:SH3 domain-containing protein n=1 Tax=Galdieria partita TaxID=83374 RepID=A0A9C7Q320_9RHOD|nr:hypothetical protein GpartN1_g6946.t1 [Galdieria partita]
MSEAYTQFQRNAPYLLHLLQRVHEGLLSFVESFTPQQQQALVSVVLCLDAAQFGLHRVQSRLELVNRNVFEETCFDQEATEVYGDLLAVQRNLVDGFQRIVTYLSHGSRIVPPEVPSSGRISTEVTEQQGTTVNLDKSLRDSEDLDTRDSTLIGKSVEKGSGDLLRTPSGRSYMIALYDFQGQEADELSFRKGDHIQVVAYDTSGWWLGQLHDKYGLFPSNYTRKMHNRHSGALSLEESFTEHSRGIHV